MQREMIRRELAAEFLGMTVLTLFGIGVNAQVALTGKGDALTVALGWGLGVAMAIYVAGGISGAHVNPAVTVAFAMRRGFRWSKVAPYITAQLAGGLVGAAIVFLVYRESFDAVGYGVPWLDQASTAGVFGTYAGAAGLTGAPVGLATTMLDQIIGTALLVLVIFAIIDERNNAPLPKTLAPLAIGLLVALIGISFGANQGFAINPARDLGPRLFSLFVFGPGVFQLTAPINAWVPIVGPLLGGAIGAVSYDVIIGRRRQANDDGVSES